MSEDRDHPRLRALLVEMAGLGQEDAELPLAMLTSVNRGNLRVLFRRAARGVGTGQSIRSYFQYFWPELGDGYEDWATYLDAIASAHTQSISAALRHAATTLKSDAERGLLRACETRWHASNPVGLCYLLIAPGPHLEPVADLLELQLGVAAGTRRMLLMLALNKPMPPVAA
jgi:hypothetical protein